MDKLSPIGDRVLIQYPPMREERRGGIWIPEAAVEKPQVAKVIAVGQKRGLKFETKAGDTILTERYMGAEIRMDGETFWIINENNIVGVIA